MLRPTLVRTLFPALSVEPTQRRIRNRPKVHTTEAYFVAKKSGFVVIYDPRPYTERNVFGRAP